MPTNDFKPFATAGGANVSTQAEYLALAALSTGWQSGKASSKEVNKAVRQATFIAAAVAQFIADKGGVDVLDDGDLAGFGTKLITAMNKTSQPLDATLTALAALVGAANKLPYFNGADTAVLTDLTQVGRDIIGKNAIADVLTYLGLDRIEQVGSETRIWSPGRDMYVFIQDGTWGAFTSGSSGGPTPLAVTNGGTGATTPGAARNNLGITTLLADKANLASPALSGIPTAPTASPGTNNYQIANTAFVQSLVAALVNSSPATLDTLKELAAALGNDANFATTMTNALAGKAPKESPSLSGIPTAPTAATNTSNYQIASTAFVQAVAALRQPLDTTLTNLSGKNVAQLLQYLGLQDLPNLDTSNNKWLWKLPNGVICQIFKPNAANDTAALSSKTTTMSFPVAFPSECFAVLVCKTSYVNVLASAENVNRTSCDVVAMPISTAVQQWSNVTLMAIGR